MSDNQASGSSTVEAVKGVQEAFPGECLNACGYALYHLATKVVETATLRQQCW